MNCTRRLPVKWATTETPTGRGGYTCSFLALSMPGSPRPSAPTTTALLFPATPQERLPEPAACPRTAFVSHTNRQAAAAREPYPLVAGFERQRGPDRRHPRSPRADDAGPDRPIPPDRQSTWNQSCPAGRCRNGLRVLVVSVSPAIAPSATLACAMRTTNCRPAADRSTGNQLGVDGLTDAGTEERIERDVRGRDNHPRLGGDAIAVPRHHA